MQLVSGTIIDRYLVESALGKGGMAEVYKVQHRQLGSRHALKILTVPTPEIRERLMQEGRVQAQLRHPNIVSVTDVVQIGESPGLVMEYIAGPTLGELLQTHRLSIPQVDMLARGIISGVQAAHRHGLVHRDLKPANILIDVDGHNLIPKVLDFGLVKVVEGEQGPLDSGMTRSGVAMGTPAYMAPEQIRDTKNVDHRADIFALGAILYELACAERAFDGDDMMDIFLAVTNGEFVNPRVRNPDLPERMAFAITHALKVDRDERTESCDTLLDEWCDGSIHSLPWQSDEARWDEQTLEVVRSLSSGTHDLGDISGSQIKAIAALKTSTWDSEDGEPVDMRALPDAPTATQTDDTMSTSGLQNAWSTAELSSRWNLLPWIVLLVGLAGVIAWYLAGPAEPPVDQVPREAETDVSTSPASSPETTEPQPEAILAPAITTPAEAPEIEPPTPDPVAAPSPPPAAPAAASEPEPEPEPEPEAEPEPEPPVPELTLAPGMAFFSVSGDMTSVRLRNDAGSLYGPGEVPADSYQIYIRGDEGLRRVGTLVLGDGERRQLSCNRLGCR